MVHRNLPASNDMTWQTESFVVTAVNIFDQFVHLDENRSIGKSFIAIAAYLGTIALGRQGDRFIVARASRQQAAQSEKGTTADAESRTLL